MPDEPPLQHRRPLPRVAGPIDATGLADLLHAFNEEFATPSPGSAVLAPRLQRLLAGNDTFAVVVGAPGGALSALALVTVRPNVWFSGPVALLDELVVVPPLRGRGIGAAVIAHVVDEAVRRGAELLEVNVDEPDVDAQRFYRRHGFSFTDDTTGERAFYGWREVGPTER